MTNRAPPLIAFAILAFNIWNSQTLITTWIDAPIEAWTWIAFLIWTLPIFVFWYAFANAEVELSTGNTLLLGLSLLAAFLSIIGSINALAYIGLALSLASFVPWNFAHLLWIMTSASWMPALGWFYSRLLPSASPLFLLSGRIFLAIVGAFGMYYFVLCKKEEQHG